MTNTRANKAKGRRWQQKIRDDLLSRFSMLKKDDDIHSTEMGQSGCDIVLSDVAIQYIPFSIEAKSHKTGFTAAINALLQSKRNQKNNTTAIAIIKQDGFDPFVVMDYNDWLNSLNTNTKEINVPDMLRLIAHNLENNNDK